MQQKKDTMTNIIVILILLCIALFGILFGVVLPAVNRPPTVMVNLPRIQTGVSDSDGREHTLTIDFSLEIDNSLKLNAQETANELESLMSELDYDSIIGLDGMDYIRETTAEYLGEKLGDDLLNIYISNLATDFSLPSDETYETQMDKVFENIFPNAE